MSEIICPHCHTLAMRGANVCVGCQAEVVYGSTFGEMKQGAIFGAVIFIIVEALILSGLDISFEFNYYLFGAAVGAFIGFFLAARAHDGSTRFFRVYHRK
ncbi:hypothetical protein [Thalassospira alkalitolerans]|uniref:Uncharacterized protein n=1 Tax=Thalassospira alkalitolerans TaxID=1293890 RepID=A0A1Y2L7Z0_9PROT|nr:hypothetical protein [Thalassospira alkalitolerans]OSQ46072.1 hypothetical protein TALK_17020 [Thalassospira alkalitolerans]